MFFLFFFNLLTMYFIYLQDTIKYFTLYIYILKKEYIRLMLTITHYPLICILYYLWYYNLHQSLFLYVFVGVCGCACACISEIPYLFFLLRQFSLTKPNVGRSTFFLFQVIDVLDCGSVSVFHYFSSCYLLFFFHETTKLGFR